MQEIEINELIYKRIGENIVSLINCTNDFKGELIVPKTIQYEGKEFDVVSIKGEALWGCCDLSSLTIPNTILNIGYKAFDSCYNLNTVYLPAFTDIDRYAFTKTGIKTINGISYLPSSIIEVGKHTFEEVGFVTFNLNEKTYKPEHKEVCVVSCEENLCGDVVIPSSIEVDGKKYPVVEIGDLGLAMSEQISSLTIPESVRKIGCKIFEYEIPIKSITCLSPIPPQFCSATFWKMPKIELLKVPTQSIEIYQSSPWAKYFERIKGI